MDQYHDRHFETTDLVKRYLSGPSFARTDFKSRQVAVQAEMSEFSTFLARFGGANTYFEYSRHSLDIQEVASLGGRCVGFIGGDQMFFVPSLLPTWGQQVPEEFFSSLVAGVAGTLTRLRVEVPDWARKVEFVEEPSLKEQRQELDKQVKAIEARKADLERMKRTLVGEGSILVEDVAFVLEAVFGLQTDSVDRFKEDLRVLDASGATLMLCEVKGVSRGVKREHINQADNHRERAALASSVPTLLIVNTSKSACDLIEKDQGIDPEQVRHAVRLNILILRTLDLVYLARLCAAGRISQRDVRDLFFGEAGWLKADTEGWSIPPKWY
ncbi:MAG: hypothetical protein JWN34_1574 [Bryobacterales bacterium]|nr:hypothetical protein [Bryobacterales bacterium]